MLSDKEPRDEDQQGKQHLALMQKLIHKDQVFYNFPF